MKRLINHGTMAAVRRHQREKTRLCEPCKETQRRESKERRDKNTHTPPQPTKPRPDLGPALARLREYLNNREAI